MHQMLRTLDSKFSGYWILTHTNRYKSILPSKPGLSNCGHCNLQSLPTALGVASSGARPQVGAFFYPAQWIQNGEIPKPISSTPWKSTAVSFHCYFIARFSLPNFTDLQLSFKDRLPTVVTDLLLTFLSTALVPAFPLCVKHRCTHNGPGSCGGSLDLLKTHAAIKAALEQQNHSFRAKNIGIWSLSFWGPIEFYWELLYIKLRDPWWDDPPSVMWYSVVFLTVSNSPIVALLVFNRLKSICCWFCMV